MTSGFLEPKQQRSRDTVARLLTATIETLEAHGLEGTTIPRVAAAAGVAPASIYRRFRDRDALYRAALMDALESGAVANGKSIRLESFADQTLEGVVARLVTIIAHQYRAHPGVMRAFTRFVEQDRDNDFRVRALALVAQNYGRLVDVLMTFRDEIGHPDPQRAVTFALLTMATIIEVRALEPVSMWGELMPISDGELEAEVTRTVSAYLRSPQ